MAVKNKITKTNYNPKSRENLAQFRKPRLRAKEKKIVNELKEELDLNEDLIQIIIPTAKIFTEEEQERFFKYLKLYLKEFSAEGELKTSDYDDIAQLCKNKILEDRLLGSVSKTGVATADIMNALDKLKKENQALKKQLATTRDQRYDPRANRDVTILDVIYSYEQEKALNIAERLEELEEEEAREADSTKYKTKVEDMIT